MLMVGVLPAVGSGLATMAGTGQLGRLVAHLDWYARRFEVQYFSYLPLSAEKPHLVALPSGVTACVQPRWASPKRALFWPLVDQRAWRGLSVCRAMNLLGAIPALTAKWAWGIPFVVSHGADYEAIARIHGRSVLHLCKWRWLRRLVFRSASAVLVSRQGLAAQLQYRYPGARVVHHANWVDLNRFQPGAPSQSRSVLYVGRLVAEKNLIRLARAVRMLDNTRLRCIGDGPDRSTLEGLGAECPGPVPWESLPKEYGRAGVFCLPSYTEGHPKALLEAMASGLPCAVSDQVGVVQHEETGLVFKADMEADMRTQIARLLDDPALAAKLGAAARKDVEQYDIDTVMPQEIALLREVATSPVRGRKKSCA